MEQIREIPIDDLVASKFNPRKNFPTKDLGELAESIKQKGILEPLLVRQTVFKGVGNSTQVYEIIAGERRFRAAELLELKTVPAIVREMGDEEARETQIIENLQRQDIAPLEEAQAFQDLLKLHNEKLVNVLDDNATKLDVQTLAKRVGKSKEYVYHRLHLLKLAAPARKALEKGSITAAHAQELAPLPAEKQVEIVEQVLSEGYAGKDEASPVSVAELRDEIRHRTRPETAPPQISAKEKARRAKEAAAEKNRQAVWKRQQAKEAAERQLDNVVSDRAVRELWPKLRDANTKTRDRMLGIILEDYMDAGSEEGPAAVLVAQGKPVPDRFMNFHGPLQKDFLRRGTAQRLAIAVLAYALRSLEFGGTRIKPLLRSFGVDTKKIRVDIRRQDVAHAKADAKNLEKAKAASGGILGSTRKAAKPVADVGKPKAKARKRRRTAATSRPPSRRVTGKRKATR